MPDIEASDIADLVVATLKQLGRGRWTMIASDLQDHVAMRHVLKKRRVTFGSGEGIKWQVMKDENNAARHVAMYGTDNVNITDVMDTAEIPWRHSETSWAYDEREVAMNRRPSRIVNLVATRRVPAMVSLAELMEEAFWGKPTSTTDKKTPYGCQYWFPTNASEGFYGQHPSGWSDVASISATTTARWRNWTATYTDISKEDLVRKMRKAATKTKFRNPVAVKEYGSTDDRYGYYTNYDVIGTMEEMVEAQNDSLGNDVASKDGSLLFRGRPVTWVPYLDDDSGDKVYGINWSKFRVVFLSGRYMRESRPIRSAVSHNMWNLFMDLTYNYQCLDRRRHFVMTK